MRDRLFIAIIILFLLALSSYSYSLQREQIASKRQSYNLKMSVDDIRYIGNNKYKITIYLMNISTETLHIDIYTPVFSVQTNTIGTRGWIKTEVFPESEQNFMLKSNEKVMKPFIVHIPLEKYGNPYITYEGDISLKVESEIIVKGGNSKAGKKMEEIYLWLRPGTNKWIYREGM